MDKILIQGGKPLKGEVVISGAKNAALPIMASTLLSPGENRIFNVPQLKDVGTMMQLLTHLGAVVTEEAGAVSVRSNGLNRRDAPYDLVKTMRASILVLGPLAARFGEARVSLPGGCAIGARPINLHLMGLEKMGAKVEIEHGYVTVKTPRLKGAPIHLDLPTVTGTENLMMAATLADGTTVIENAAREPEVADLASFLNKRGARIHGAGTDILTIEGVDRLDSADHTVMPDRIEAGTYLFAAAMTGGEVMVKGFVPRHLDAVLLKLREAGVEWVEYPDGIRMLPSPCIRAVDVRTAPYPGFATDMQAQMMALMSISDGLSVITETIFENRFTHVAELRRMGADIKIEKNNAIIKGTPRLSGAPVMASDLRASACLVLAGLAAEGETTISRVYHLDRGYERLEEKFFALGAQIRWVKGTG
jgi:UDP-N-acetylglucosamine 1-carboxyvinyltransferase